MSLLDYILNPIRAVLGIPRRCPLCGCVLVKFRCTNPSCVYGKRPDDIANQETPPDGE